MLLCFSCKKKLEEPTNNTFELEDGILVLNEGLFQQNNSSISWVNLSNQEVITDIFLKKNERYLGDTGNDMQVYGGKIYVVVSSSSTIEVLDKTNLKSIKQIQLHYNNQAQQPRSIAFYGKKAYVTSYDGFVNVIDTASFIVEQRILVGANPEGIAVVNDHLYVANSGGLNWPNVDSTVYAIDLNTHLISHTFHVGANPGALVGGSNGQIYVIKRGNYSADPSELVIIDPINQIISNTGIPATLLASSGNKIYIGYYNYTTQQSQVSILSQVSNTIMEPNAISGHSIQTLYGIQPLNDGRFICLDARGFTNLGEALLFDATGNFYQAHQVGLNPNKILYYE